MGRDDGVRESVAELSAKRRYGMGGGQMIEERKTGEHKKQGHGTGHMGMS